MNPWRGLTGLRGEIWFLCGATLVNRMGTMALPFLVLYLTQGMHWRPEEAGFALFLYGTGALAAAPASGRMADTLGHLLTMRASLWGSGALMFLIPLVKGHLILFLLAFLWGALTQAFSPSVLALLASLSAPDQRKAVFSLQRLSVNLGMGMGPALGGVLAHHSYRWVFVVDGVTTMAAAILLGRYPITPCDRPFPVPGPSRRAWKDPRLARLLLGFLPVLLVFTQIQGVLPLWVVRDLGLGNPFFGLLFTVNTLAIVSLEVPLNLRMAAWKSGPQMLLGSCFYAVGFGLTNWATSRSGMVAVVLIWTFGEMILLPAVSDAVVSLAPHDRRGEYLGLHAATFAAAFTLGPWLGVLAYARLGPPWVWAGGFLLAAFGGLVLGRFRTSGNGR